MDDIYTIKALKEEGISWIRRLCDERKYNMLKKLVEISYVVKPSPGRDNDDTDMYSADTGGFYMLKDIKYNNHALNQILDYAIQKDYMPLCLIFFNELKNNFRYFVNVIMKYKNIDVLILILKSTHIIDSINFDMDIMDYNRKNGANLIDMMPYFKYLHFPSINNMSNYVIRNLEFFNDFILLSKTYKMPKYIHIRNAVYTCKDYKVFMVLRIKSCSNEISRKFVVEHSLDFDTYLLGVNHISYIIPCMTSDFYTILYIIYKSKHLVLPVGYFNDDKIIFSSYIILKLFLMMQYICSKNSRRHVSMPKIDMHEVLSQACSKEPQGYIKLLESYMPCFEYVDTDAYKECLICMDTRKDDKPYEPLYPCGHRGYCEVCIKKMDKKCPRCRQKILRSNYKLQ